MNFVLFDLQLYEIVAVRDEFRHNTVADQPFQDKIAIESLNEGVPSKHQVRYHVNHRAIVYEDSHENYGPKRNTPRDPFGRYTGISHRKYLGQTVHLRLGIPPLHLDRLGRLACWE